MKRSLRLGSRILLLVVCGTILVVAGLVWRSLNSVETLFTENKRLHESLARLQEEAIIGHLWLVSRSEGPDGVRTTFVWMEPAATDANDVARVETLTVNGETVYLDGFAVRFPGELVADGKARNLFFWHRAFGDDQAPNAGVPLDDGSGAPARYAALFGEVFQPDESISFWNALWDLAHNSQALAELGIHALYGNAVSIQPRPRFLYTVKLSAAGALSIEPAPLAGPVSDWTAGGSGPMRNSP